MGQTLVYGILNGSLYGIIALGIALVFGIMKYLNLAQGTLIILGAYIGLYLSQLGLDPFLCIPAVMIALFLFAAVLFKACFSRLINFAEEEKIKNSLLISFGLMLFLDNLITVIWTSDERSITPVYSGVTFELFGLRIPVIGLAGALLAVILILLLHLFLTRTYFGQSVVAVSQDQEAASLMGVNVSLTFLTSFAISVSIASIPSMLIALQSFSPTVGLHWFNKGIVVVILSGIGNIYGVLPAGLFLGTIEALSVYVFGPSYREVTGLAVFVLILILVPNGLFRRRGAA